MHVGAQDGADVRRRLDAAKLIYQTWTMHGTDPSYLAQCYLDGAIDTLDDYVKLHEQQPACPGIPLC